MERAKNAGINPPGIFDAAISVAQPLTRPTDEDEQVRQLVAQKGAFSASTLWNVCGTRVANSRVVIRAQREQLAINDAKFTMVEQNRLSESAVKAVGKCTAGTGKAPTWPKPTNRQGLGRHRSMGTARSKGPWRYERDKKGCKYGETCNARKGLDSVHSRAHTSLRLLHTILYIVLMM